jgi:hypothetical protein
VSECNRKASMMIGPGPLGAVAPWGRGGGGGVAMLDENHFKYEPGEFLRSVRCQRFMNQSTDISNRERERKREMKTDTSGCRIPVFVQQNDSYF